MPLEWKKDHSVGVEEIDEQHKQLIKIMNRLYEAINNMKTKEELGGILGELVSYARYHFSTEEKYFDMFGFEFSDEHKKEHQKFKEKIITIQKQFKGNEIKISFDLSEFLEDWLVDHLMIQDMKYVECFKEHGLN